MPLSPSWSEFLTAQGARIDEGRILDFGNPDAERAATAQGNVYADLSPRALLQVGGADAEAFLQGQLTCDVKALAVGQSSFGAYCTAKGRMLASFLILRTDDGYLLLLAQDIAEATRKRLQMFVLRAKVKIELLDGMVALGIAGAQTALPQYAAFSLPGDRFISVAPNEAAAQSLWHELKASAQPVGFPCWEWLDIRHGEPWIGAATLEEFVPQMTNLEKIGGVSFKKGCYPGQEIVARTQYLGKASRRMHWVHSADALAAGDPIYADAMGEQACGTIVNAARAPGSGWDALAVVHGKALGGPVHASGANGPLLEFRTLPYPVE